MRQIKKILLVGDTVPSRPFDFGPSLRSVCLEHDLRVFNLEGAFSDLRKPLLKAGPHLLLEKSFFGPVAECFNVAALGNNHAMDFGVEGLETTIRQCRSSGIATVGAGSNVSEAFAPVDAGACRIISVAEHEFGAADVDKAGIAAVDRPLELYSLIKAGRDADKFVIVVAHGGTERIPIPPPYLRRRYKLWVEYGADLIVGNHPHVVQGYEVYQGRPIFYSLGNFVFPTDSNDSGSRDSWSLAVSVDVSSRSVRLLPVKARQDGSVDIDCDARYTQEIERLCGLIQSDGYDALYVRTAVDLYEKWYPRLKTASAEDAGLLLHYFRCDAHRNLVQTALSQKAGETTAPQAGGCPVRGFQQGDNAEMSAKKPQMDLGGESENWFCHERAWDRLLAPFKGRDGLCFLELGSWKGRSAIWLAENILSARHSKIICVDVWDVRQWNREAEETKALLGNARRAGELQVESLYETFLSNTRHLRDKIIPVRKKTADALREFIGAGEKFDFIYIDADHSEQAVYEDFCLSRRCLKPGGMIFLDDLSWDSVRAAVQRIREQLGLEIMQADDNGAYYVAGGGRQDDPVPRGMAERATSAGNECRDTHVSGGPSAAAIKTMDGRDLGLPQLSDVDSANYAQRPSVEELLQDLGRWANPRLVYLASADQWLGLEEFFKNNDLMQCDVFYCVIGGLGGLNLLSRLKRLKKLVFYDANIYAALILDLQLQLIRRCSSVDEYISLIYQRPFDRSRCGFTNQADFLGLPLNEEYGRCLERTLTAAAYETYRHFYLPYVTRQASALYDGPTFCCTDLLPFFESGASTDPLVSGLDRDSVNVNTFYVGKGWLHNDETFLAVRSHLSESEIEIRIGDIAQLRPEGSFPGVYTTNIYNTGRRTEYKKFSHLFRWVIGYDDSTGSRVRYYPSACAEGMVEYERLIGAGNGNPHATCCQAIDAILDLNANEFLEVIEPPPSEGMRYGFRFYKGQKPIKVKEYLDTRFSDERVIVVHILLGGGTSRELWREVCRKAVRESKRYVLIFEHRKECGDWPQQGVCHGKLLTHERLDQFIYSLDCGWRKYGIANVKGDVGDVRNVLYSLDKTQPLGRDCVDSAEERIMGGFGSMLSGVRDPGGILADIQRNDSVVDTDGAALTETTVCGEAERVSVARRLLESGVSELGSGRASDALRYFDKAISVYPDAPEAYYARATAYMQRGDLLSAAEACRIELFRRPDHCGARRLLERIEDVMHTT